MSFTLLGILQSQAAAGGAPAFEHIATTTLGSNASSITLSSLDTYTDYQHLQIRGRMQGNATGTGESYGKWQINGTNVDTMHGLEGQGTTLYSSQMTNMYFTTNQNDSGNTAGGWTNFTLDFLDFGSTNKNSTVRILHGASPYFPNSPRIQITSLGDFSTSTVTSLGFTAATGSLIAGTEWRLYGIKGA